MKLPLLVRVAFPPGADMALLSIDVQDSRPPALAFVHRAAALGIAWGSVAGVYLRVGRHTNDERSNLGMPAEMAGDALDAVLSYLAQFGVHPEVELSGEIPQD